MTTIRTHPSLAVPHRIFLGWDRPLLHLLSGHLLAGASSSSGLIDLTDTIVILPGTRAGRRLTELLLEPSATASSTGQARPTGLLPPTISTIHGLWNLVAAPPPDVSPARVATPLEQRLAWIAALRAAPRAVLADLGPAAPAHAELPSWLALADFLNTTHSELAGNAIAFGDIPSLALAVADFPDAPRWHAAAHVERLYHIALEHAGLIDPAEHRERCLAEGAIRTNRPVIIAGVTDMNRAARRLIDSLGDACTIGIFSPPELADRFDAHGCVIPDKWADAPIPITDARLHMVSGPTEQALAALRAVAGDSSEQSSSRLARLSADQVTIGVPDVEVADRLCLLSHRATDAAQHLAAGSAPIPTLHVRSAAGTPMMRSQPMRLLVAVTEFLQSLTFEAFATLVRHPDVERWLLARFPFAATTESWLSFLDRYQSQHLHWIIDGAWHTTDQPTLDILEQLYTHLASLLAPLRGLKTTHHPQTQLDTPSSQPLVDWAEPVWSLLSSIYSDPSAAGNNTQHIQDPHTLAACELLYDSLQTLRSVPHSLTMDLSCTAAAAVRIVCSMVASFTIPDEAKPGAIELLGWLELPLDDSPVMVITGMNEGIVPGPDRIDPLLPASLRTRLGLPSPSTRFARDAWSLSAILASRPSTTLICARRNARGDPLSPSRLLLAADGHTIATRVLRWATTASAEEAAPSHISEVMDDIPARSAPSISVGFARQPMPVSTAITNMSVTSFKEYINSPYGYYLKYVARLSEQDSRPHELDAMLFGTLLHDVLRKLQTADAAASTNPDYIADFLLSSLTAVAHQSFGEEPMPAVWLQLRQARDRLHALARWQAGWAAQGWRIHKTEWSPDKHAAFLDVDGTPMFLSGRIDRIDINEATGQVAILDYKTGDNPPDIKKLQTSRGDWRDLQLPLYRHLIRPLSFPDLSPPTLKLGYITIARDSRHTGASFAEWTTDDLESADRFAADIVRNVRAGNFSELGNDPPAHGILANISGTSYRALTEPADDTKDEGSEDAS